MKVIKNVTVNSQRDKLLGIRDGWTLRREFRGLRGYHFKTPLQQPPVRWWFFGFCRQAFYVLSLGLHFLKRRPDEVRLGPDPTEFRRWTSVASHWPWIDVEDAQPMVGTLVDCCAAAGRRTA